MRRLILLVLLITALATNICYSQKQDTLIFRKDTSGVKPYFVINQFIDSELYAWHLKNTQIPPPDNYSFGRMWAFVSDSLAASFFFRFILPVKRGKATLAKI